MSSKVVISDSKKFEKVKKKIKEAGKGDIFVITDFNKTFTKAFIDGKKVSTSFASIRDNDYLGEEYINEAKKYFKKYHPIEIDPNISAEEKDASMKEWWKIHFDVLIKYGISKDIFLELIRNNKVQLREGVKEFLKFLKDKDVPVLIISSGLGDFIPMMLEENGILYDNISVLSNLFEFDEDGKAKKIGETIIHTSNKKALGVEQLDIYSEWKKRKSVVLLGDDLTDLEMIEDFEYDNLIKIGFLNDKVDEKVDLYKENFDVVLTGDQEFDYVNELVWEVLG